ncbi:MAG TPA: hypothetical protein VHA57_00215 [Actinomycetota bacterium]|nr:hypothetical protein [Actinomycetota bacterium]
MTAVARYELRSLLLTQRWVAPFLIYAAFLAILYAGPAGPGMTAFAITAFGLIPIGAFVTRALLHSEDDIARQVTVAAAGSPVRVQSAALLACAGLTAVLAVVAVAWGVVADSVHQLPLIAGGLAIHLLFGLFGIALGAAFSRPLVTPVGPAVLGIVAGTTLALGIPVSPVAWTIRDLIHHSAAGHLAGPSAAVLVLAVAGIGASVLAASR